MTCATVFAAVVLATIPARAAAGATAAPVAYVYVQTVAGVNVYGETAAGALTLVPGSPFADTGQMQDVNGGYLISVGTDDLHSYKIGANGSVGEQASVIDTQNYGGSECGATSYNGPNSTPNGSVLDHTGKYLYVQLFNDAYEGCAAWQSYQVGANGSLTFLGDFEDEADTSGNVSPSTVPTISSNDNFGYALFQGYGGFVGYRKSTNGELTLNPTFTEVDPGVPANSGDAYEPLLVQADPAGHLASLMYLVNYAPFGTPQKLLLASYTINNANGNITSTNTSQNAPSPKITMPTAMRMSPSGQLLALAGAPGLQIFHFNGASPVTAYSALLLPTTNIDQLAWDNDNHLFALSYKTGTLYVYTVTLTSLMEAAGSPYQVPNAYGFRGLIAVPK